MIRVAFPIFLFVGNHLQSELGSALRELLNHPFLVALFVVILALIGVFLALGEHRVDEAGELVGCGGDSLELCPCANQGKGGMEVSRHSPSTHPNRPLPTAQRLGLASQRLHRLYQRVSVCLCD